ncbi:hypothetical protein IFM89_036448 [Coptis chinensis]|uniref:Uncharacterized protein n=1 Tax=Coptis chinensis TaxID=261450 RepID=A0A835I1S5_9MAGN|nr:hypothetical protein IFM89_036448 [Coptis chinensis]
MTENIVETLTVGEGDKVGEATIVDASQEAETLVKETQNVVEANIAVEIILLLQPLMIGNLRDVVEDSPVTPQSSTEIWSATKHKVCWNHLVGRTKLKENGRYKRRNVPSLGQGRSPLGQELSQQVHANTSYVIRRALWHDLMGIGSNVDAWMQQEYDKELDREELKGTELSIWKQKTRTSRAFDGERNSSYFHVVAKLRMNNSQIAEIEDAQGQVIRE